MEQENIKMDSIEEAFLTQEQAAARIAALKVKMTLPEELNADIIEEALDFIFAKKCNLKVCSYCQTINQKDSGRCIACGKHLHRKWKS